MLVLDLVLVGSFGGVDGSISSLPIILGKPIVAAFDFFVWQFLDRATTYGEVGRHHGLFEVHRET